MIDIGYNNRWVRLVKDLLFVALGVWFLVRGRLLGAIVGMLALYWYGRDAWFQAKALWQEKTYRAPGSQNDRPDSPSTQSPSDDKITVTDNLQNAKEVDFKKE